LTFCLSWPWISFLLPMLPKYLGLHAWALFCFYKPQILKYLIPKWLKEVRTPTIKSWMWWQMSVISAFGGPRQEDLVFLHSLCYLVRPCLNCPSVQESLLLPLLWHAHTVKCLCLAWSVGPPVAMTHMRFARNIPIP
jgi:hypothetical protein